MSLLGTRDLNVKRIANFLSHLSEPTVLARKLPELPVELLVQVRMFATKMVLSYFSVRGLHMLDLASEDLFPLTDTANIPGRPHPTTVGRWATRGVRGIRLETVRIGGRLYTSAEAVQRFVAALTATDGLVAAVPPASCTEDYDRLLDAEGF